MSEEYDPYEGAGEYRWQPSPEDLAQMGEWDRERDEKPKLHAVDEAYEEAAEAKFRHANAVVYELERMRAREEAKAILAAEKLPPPSPLVITTADQMRATLPVRPPARIEGVLPGNGGALLIAQAGTGKTTLIGNMTRDLLEGTPFLDTCEVRPLKGRVALLSYEMDAGELLDWYDSVGVDPRRFVLVDLRGRTNPLADDQARLALAADLKALDVDLVMIDTFGRAFTGESQDSAAEVTGWFVMLDGFVRDEVGAAEWIVTAHAGWSGERGRGSSALHDSPDSVLLYVKDSDDNRTLRAEKYRGRNALQKTGVTFDPSTLRVTAGLGFGGTHERAVLQFVEDNPGCTQNQIASGIHRNERAVSDTCKRLAADGRLVRTPGPRNSVLHSLPPEAVGGTSGAPLNDHRPASIEAVVVAVDETPLCDTCDQAEDDHLPGCPRRAS